MKVFLLVCLLAHCSGAQDAANLVGRWRSVETSKGGIGAMYDFAADGTARFSPGAIVPMQYRLNGDQLAFYPSEGQASSLSWIGDDHMRMSVNGGSEELTRLGARRDAENKLIGEWIGTRDMAGKRVVTHWIFGEDSNAVFMIRFLTQTGRYTVQGGRLAVTFGGQVGLDGAISLADGILAINRSRGRITRLSRY